jgi:uncharacterized protein with NRDE domain
MCTVTYIPVRNGFYLTSNRDEKQSRPAALEPGTYRGRTGSLLFPKDRRAGGTWFAVHEKGHVAVLLNGACHPHTPKPPYRRSRGLILLDLIDQPNSLQAFLDIDLDNIEPFTFILVEEGRLHECRWDGLRRSHRRPDAGLPHIWSSATLYSPEVIRKRERWFRNWLEGHPQPDSEAILGWHQQAGEGDAHNDVLMNRGGQMLTVSIICLNYHRNGDLSGGLGNAQLIYLDVSTGKMVHSSFLTPHSTL